MMILRCTCFVMLYWAFRWRLLVGQRRRFISSIIIVATSITPFITIIPSRPCVVTTRHDDLCCCCVCATRDVCACVCVFLLCSKYYDLPLPLCPNIFKCFQIVHSQDISPTALTFSPKCLSDVHIPTYIACIVWIFSHKTM